MRLFLLIPFFTFSQITVNKVVIPDDAIHFYAEVAFCETIYQIQQELFPKQDSAWRLFNTWAVGQVAAFGKEIFDMYKRNPTGFQWTDIAPDQLGIHVYIMVRISLNDFRKYMREVVTVFMPVKKRHKYKLSPQDL